MGVLMTHCNVCGGLLAIRHRGNQVITGAKHPTPSDCFKVLVDGSGRTTASEYDVTTLEDIDTFRFWPPEIDEGDQL